MEYKFTKFPVNETIQRAARIARYENQWQYNFGKLVVMPCIFSGRIRFCILEESNPSPA